MAKSNGVILWAGASLLDGAPIVAIATGLNGKSANTKTGGMVQTWILRSDVSPLDAIRTGADKSVCGGCIHRPNLKTGKRTCYVNIGQAPRSIFLAFKRGRYNYLLTGDYAATFAGRAVRFGAYGDPAAVPVAVWENVKRTCGMYTGYTHQWRSEKFSRLLSICQASCETVADVENANRRGWGTFRVVPVGGTVPEAETCPASAEGGKVATCETCGMCNGRKGLNIAIIAHGATAKRYTGGRELSVL